MKIDLSKLMEAVKIMCPEGEEPGAPIVWNKPEREIKTLTPKDLQDIREIGGILTLHGNRIAIYIPEEYVSTGWTGKLPWGGKPPTTDELRSGEVKPKHKTHVTICQTIEEMKKAGRVGHADSDKVGTYAGAINPDGWFITYPRTKDKRTGEELLLLYDPCINCLRKLNYKGCRNHPGRAKQLANEIGSNDERAKEFFDKYFLNADEMRPPAPEDLPENSYTDDWEIATGRKRSKENWTCENCGVNLHDYRAALHTHHKDGNKGNDSPENLVVLCKACHAKQPFHGHMKHTDKT